MWVMIVTRNTADPDELPDRRRMNFDDSDAQHWLFKHQYWAIRNNRSVTISRIPKAKG